MKTYNQISFPKVIEILTQVALGASAVSTNLIISDMSICLSEFRQSIENKNFTFYFAIREMGAECGNKEHCIARCKSLGYPLVIAKIETEKMDYNMTIMFTHGWMDRDNNYMEQEFNSL